MKKKALSLLLILSVVISVFPIVSNTDSYANVSYSYRGNFEDFYIVIDNVRMSKIEFKIWLANNDFSEKVDGSTFDIPEFICGIYGQDFLYSDDNAIIELEFFANAKKCNLKNPVYDLYNGDVLVPMKEIFYALGGAAGSNDDLQTMIAIAGKNNILVTRDSDKAVVNGREILLGDSSKLINGEMYISLSFVAEVFDAVLVWDKPNKFLSISAVGDIDMDAKLKQYTSSIYFKDDYINMEIVDNKSLEVSGAINPKYQFMIVSVDSDTQKNIIEKNKKIKGDNYNIKCNLKSNIKNGDYTVNTFVSNKEYGTYKSYYFDIPLKYIDGEFFFPRSPIYKANYIHNIKNLAIDPTLPNISDDYLEIKNSTYKSMSEADKKKIIDLANKITKGAKTDYDKLLKINDWVAENIYYDWDSYLKGEYGDTTAIGTLNSKKSVCQGYAELTNALCRASRIPCKVVGGHALGVSARGGNWDEVDHNDSNHAWNEAFVNGRWVIFDTTWNSRNKYKNGKFEKGDKKHIYFDPTLETFSYDHKYLD